MKLFYIFILAFLSVITAQNKIEIKNAWIRPGAEGMNTALYFDIVNPSNKQDTLYKAECNVSKIVELHETYKKGDMMGMRKTDFVIIKPRSTFKFQPGGNHVMLIDLKKKIPVGENYEANLFFKNAGKIKTKASVKR